MFSLGLKICQVRITLAIWWAVTGISPASCGKSSEAKMCYCTYVSVYALVTVQALVNGREERAQQRAEEKADDKYGVYKVDCVSPYALMGI